MIAVWVIAILYVIAVLGQSVLTVIELTRRPRGQR